MEPTNNATTADLDTSTVTGLAHTESKRSVEPTTVASSTDAATSVPVAPIVSPPATGEGGVPAGGGEAHYKTYFTLNWFATLSLVFEFVMIIIFGTATTYAAGINVDVAGGPGPGGFEYAAFQDTHVMMLIGFGFLYTLLRRYAWSGVGWNFIVTVFTIQWALLLNGFWGNAVARTSFGAVGFPRIELSLASLINADYTAATVLISFGALLGRVSPTKMLIMLFFEVVFATANAAIAAELNVRGREGGRKNR